MKEMNIWQKIYTHLINQISGIILRVTETYNHFLTFYHQIRKETNLLIAYLFSIPLISIIYNLND